MPVASEFEIGVTEVKKGDRVFDKFTGLDSTRDCTAYDVKSGHKYVTIKNANGEILSRREFGERVTIERMIPTEEEIAQVEFMREARRAERLEEDISGWVNSTLDNYGEQSVIALAAIAETPGRDFSGRSGFISLLNLGAYHAIATTIKALHDYTGNEPEVNRTWAESYQMWRERVIDKTMERYRSYPFQKDVINLAMDEAMENAERIVYHAADYGSFSVR